MRPTPLTAFVLCAIAASLSGCEEASSGVDAPDKGDRDATPSCRGDTCDDSETSPPDEAQCGGDGDCPEGEVCHQGACQVGCRSDTDCQEGEVCEALSCATGCRNPSDCPTGFTCVAGQCEEEGCSSDEDCGAGARCSDETCQEIGAAACESDDDCGLRWRCSAVTGLCIDTLCAADGDCSTQTWCLNGLCEPRRAQLGQVNLARQYITGPSDHRWALSDLDQATFGGGGGLFDMDGDLDLDLFLGGRVTGSTTNEHCVYENVSEPGALRFEKVEEYCNQSLGDAESAWAIDVEGDGVEELLLLGRRQVTLLRFSPQVETTDLLESLPERDLRRLCTATSALVQDVDHDGMIDIVVGCRLPSQVIDQIRQTSYPNIFIRQTSPGQFLPSEGPFQETYGDRGSTLALGSIDVDLDGLDDILVVNDAYIGDFMTEFEPPSGGVFRRCSPDEDCIVELLQFGIPPRDFGSFMGLGNVHVDGIGDHIYITDISSNHLITYSGQEVADVATDLGVDLASNNNVPLFAWSVIVDDFDRNGLDDFIVTQGAVEDDFFQFQFHFEGLLLQRADGDFTLQTEEAGLMPHSSEDSGTTIAYASRGGVKADLDLDGNMEIIIAGMEGQPLIYSEVSSGLDPPRCTLVPRATVVKSHGWGYAVAPPDGDDWRRRDIQGQMSFGASSWVLSSIGAGRLRFASGAIVPFDCEGKAGPLEVHEPEWIEVSVAQGEMTIAIETPWLSAQPTVEFVFDNDRTLQNALASDEPGRFEAPSSAEAAAIMLKVNGRWVARWYPL